MTIKLKIKNNNSIELKKYYNLLQFFKENLLLISFSVKIKLNN